MNFSLLDLKEKPVRITEIRAYGFWWDFTDQIAEINIIRDLLKRIIV